MKKIFLILVFVGGFINAQNVIYVDGTLSTGAQIGINWENSVKEPLYLKKIKHSGYIKLLYGQGTLSTNNPAFKDIDGSGFIFETGKRIYFNKEEIKGFYTGFGFGIGSLEFEQNNFYDTSVFGGDGKFYGEYRYFYIPIELGYKFLIAQKIAFNIYAGTNFNIERSPKGDVSNSSFDNIVPRLGLAVGYSF